MFKWKRKVIGNRVEYKLVLEVDETEVIGSVMATEEVDGWKVEAEYKEIGYKGLLEHVDKKKLNIIISDLKNLFENNLKK